MGSSAALGIESRDRNAGVRVAVTNSGVTNAISVILIHK